ncbi:ribbon-helix-helix domain-containing protein [Candidatus Micrarchaeota archaeon]|nr:ribbon-helix-helix domain-containing protein [Candidatus Micrarchaeota archaeon]
MHTITLKLQETTFRKVEKAMKNFDYSTKTDFIREAIRDKLKELEREKAWKNFEKLKGASPIKYSDEEYMKIREKVGEEFMKKFKD